MSLEEINPALALDLDRVLFVRSVYLEDPSQEEEDIELQLDREDLEPLRLFLRSESFYDSDVSTKSVYQVLKSLGEVFPDRFITVRTILDKSETAKGYYLIPRNRVVLVRYEPGSQIERAEGTLYITLQGLEDSLELPVARNWIGLFSSV